MSLPSHIQPRLTDGHKGAQCEVDSQANRAGRRKLEPEPEAGHGDPGDRADALAYGELLGDTLVPAAAQPPNTHTYSTA